MYQGLIVKAVRKYYEISQIDFAKMLQSSQSALSKIESGVLELSAEKWINLCLEFNLDPHCLINGQIQLLSNSQISNLNKITKVGGFKIPKNHQHFLYSTVRSAWPFIQFFINSFGEKKFNDLLDHLGYEKEYFVIMSNPLSLLFIEELVMTLIQNNKIQPRTTKKILESHSLTQLNKYALSVMGTPNKESDFLERFVELIPNLYEKNSEYKFLPEKNFIINVTDAPHLKEFKLNEEFKAFRKQYNLDYFNYLRGFYFAGGTPLQLKTKDNGWQVCKI